MTLPSHIEERVHGTGTPAPAGLPLLIDVERGLLQCDVDLEWLLASFKLSLRRFLEVLGQTWLGWSAPKSTLGEKGALDGSRLPVNAALADLAAAEAAKGRPVYLVIEGTKVSAADLLERFPFIAGTITFRELAHPDRASVPGALARRFPDGFAYAATPSAEPLIWRHAASALLVGGTERDRRRIAALAPISGHIRRPPVLGSLLRSLRLHQWTKNLLVFAPFILGGAVTNPHAWLATMAVFLAMGLVSSSTYLINDIVDAADDRRHWSKWERPIARGDLSVSTAAAFAALGLLSGLGLAGLVTWRAVQVLLIYIALTLAYSFGIKRLPLIDGFTLATLFTLRLALGVVTTQVPPSPWLFVFSMFLFTSLSLAKRYTELDRSTVVQNERIAGRGYRVEDAPLVLAVGITAGLGAVTIMILYIIEDAFRQSFYGSELWLWGFPPVVFLLICRIWLVTARGEMNDDPVKFLIGDSACRALLLIFIACFAFAWMT